MDNDRKGDYPIIPSDREDDLHNLEFADSADLVLFVAGNQFMVMEEVLDAFKASHPSVRKIFYETLPPGLELKQILTGGAVFKGRFIDIMPDVYASVTEDAMHRLEQSGHIEKGAYSLYLHNRLVLMVPEDNPGKIVDVTDLGDEHIRISQPNPEYEDIALYIIEMYRQAGGAALVSRIMEKKRAEGTTIFTIVHHRETPLRIMKRTVDVGPVWATEYVHAKRQGHPVEMIDPGDILDQRNRINYYMCCLKNARNSKNADEFIRFIQSNRAQSIYEAYGFVRHF